MGYCTTDKTLRIVLPLKDRKKYFESAHAGVFGGHLGSAKVYGQLAKHYRWSGICQDIVTWSRSCQVGASQ